MRDEHFERIINDINRRSISITFHSIIYDV